MSDKQLKVGIENTAARGQLVMRSSALPEHTNANGDIFGGWILAEMDLGGSVLARRVAGNRVVTVSVESMTFLHPVKVGDLVSCYAEVDRIGRTSIRINLEAWVWGYQDNKNSRVTEGVFTYVAIDDDGKPTPVLKP